MAGVSERSVASRLASLFQQLEKIGGKAAKNSTNSEDLSQIRYVTGKIHQILNTQEKIHRDSVLKNPAQIDLLLSTIKNSSDRTVVLNIIHCLLELIGKTQVGKRASVLVSANATSILLAAVLREWEESTTCDEILYCAHQILAKLAQKDRKFALKARLNRVLPVTLCLIKNNTNNFKQLQTYLVVFKHYTSNSVNASYLGKHNAIPPIFRVIQQCGRKHTSSLKLAVEILNNLTKSRNNAARTIGGDHVPFLLALYHEWHQMDTKHRYVNIRKGILNSIKNITNLKSGRKALVDSNGIQILYDSAQEVIDCREMESLILLASVIMRKCCPRNKLPLHDIRSAVAFELPESELYPESSRQGSAQGSSQDSDNSSGEDDDDIDSDDERFKTDAQDEVEEDQGSTPQNFKRTAEDLRMYDTFFPELFEIELPEEEEEFQEGAPSSSIFIPTGTIDTVSMSSPEKDFSRLLPHPHSGMYRTATTISYTSSKNSSGYGSMYYEAGESMDNLGLERSESASAINLKTGSSVFSLDFPSPIANKGTLKKTPLMPKLSSNKKTKSVKKLPKDKKSKKTLPAISASVSAHNIDSGASALVGDLESDFVSALCITPVPAIQRDPFYDLERVMTSSSEEDEMETVTHDPVVFREFAGSTNGVYGFEKIAYPDLVGAKAPPQMEHLYRRKFGVQRAKVFEDIDRMIHPANVIDRDVYNLDVTIQKFARTPQDTLDNRDPMRIGSSLETGTDTFLRFNAHFESGNLRKAIWVRDYEYDLILNPDINTNHHHQWFYFEVSNMQADTPYRFNIVNCEKLNSQFNFGMRPVMFSVSDALDGKPYWTRVGTDICYYRNHFTRSSQATGGVKGKTYYTTTFTIKFKHTKDICYLAYHYPYTYTTLQTHLHLWMRQCNHDQIFLRQQVLCQTLSGNDVPVLTVTALPKSMSREHVEELRSRPYIFLSARVHPGESNASWVMKGTIDFLLSKRPIARLLRESFIFKIVPMLNPDGVINGNHRCSLGAEDLNRRWDNPCPKLHPTIYHTKGLLQYMQMIGKVPLVFCDYHGHSRRKNIFIYGCSPTMSWIQNDTENPACTGNRLEDNGYKTMPRLLHMSSPVFSWQNCSFVVEKAKETTARVVVWRQIGVIRSYTMESSYCGIDKEGKCKDQHISTTMLEEMGQKFCETLMRIRTRFNGFDTMASLPATLESQSEGALQRDDNLDEDDNYCGREDIDDMNEESSSEDLLSGDDDDYDDAYADDPSLT